MSVWQQLKNRGVIRAAAAYLIVAWLLVQVIVTIKEPLGLPDRTDTLVIVLLAAGFPAALVLSWLFDLTPGGPVVWKKYERADDEIWMAELSR